MEISTRTFACTRQLTCLFFTSYKFTVHICIHNLYISVLDCVNLGSDCTSCESDLGLHCPDIWLHLSADVLTSFTVTYLYKCT